VRVEAPNKGMKLKPGMYADGKLNINLKAGLVVPRSSVFMSGNDYIVWVQKEKGKYSPRKVILGLLVKPDKMNEEYYQVISGLETGESVVTNSGFLIDSESKLRSASGQSQEHKE
jgi:Cu(I)/Ag(I) efflux system membrane fusion protein